MNREILFRGKRIMNDEWKEGYYSEFSYDRGQGNFICDSDFDYTVYPETVGQYIGLTDKNGKKIFEGDILESPIKRIGRKLGNLIVITDIRECKYIALYANTYSVIGNIHDNPELLKGGGEG